MRHAGITVNFQHGNASDMPFPDCAFDFTFCQAAFKNFSEPVKAISEMYRVLKPHGVAVIADMRGDASARDLEREVQGMRLGTVNKALTLWTFRHMLVKSAYSVAAMEAMVARTPFGTCRIDVEGIGFQVWMRK